MTKKIQVEGNPNLYRDKYSGAILNCNIEEMKLAKIKRSEKQKIQSLEEKIYNLETNILELQDLIKNIVQENKK